MKPKLIVVDDESDMAEFVCNAASAMGFDASWMDNAEEFSNACPSNCGDCDVLILDLFMPRVDGIELLRFLAERRIGASIILMSGKDIHILRSAREMASELGLNVLGTLQKPFKLVELEEILKRYDGEVAEKTADLPSGNELVKAIAEQQLSVAYQPQVRMSDRSVVAFEALARWTHPDRGMVPPAHFIPLAERHGLISAITDTVNKIAFRQCGKWHSQGLKHRLSVNLSPRILVDLKLPETLEKMAEDNRIKTEDIVLEVTETAVTEDMAKHIDILTRLRMKGFDLAIDDFGTGHSSLQQLIKVPFNELKIDQAFVKFLDSDEECRSIIESSILLAHKLGMRVVAEGIESENVWHKLRDLDCDIGQGYWIGKPMPADELGSWMAGRPMG